MSDLPKLTDQEKLLLIGSIRWHQAHWCWCGETHDLFEADDLNDVLEEAAIARQAQRKQDEENT